MKIFLLVLTTILFSYNMHPKAEISNFKGKWHSAEMDNIVVYVYKAKDGYWYGKIVESDDKSDIGKLMLKKLSPSKEQNQLKGKVRKPDTGFEANATLELDRQNRLKLTTYILWV